jgi:hypothetical protein
MYLSRDDRDGVVSIVQKAVRDVLAKEACVARHEVQELGLIPAH